MGCYESGEGYTIKKKKTFRNKIETRKPKISLYQVLKMQVCYADHIQRGNSNI